MTSSPAQPEPQLPAPDRRERRGLIRLAILAVMLGLIAWYVTAHWDQARNLGKVRWPTIAAVAGLDMLIYVYSAAAVVLTVHLFAVRLGAGEAMLLALVTRFGNVLLPLRGGAAVRAVYLNKKHGLPYADFLAGLSAMLLTTLSVCLLCALAGLGYFGLATGRYFPWVMAVLAGALLAVVATVVIRPRLPGKVGGKIRGHIQRLIDGYHLISRHKPSLLGLLGVGAFQIVTMAGIYSLLLAGMGRPANPVMLVVVVALGNVSTVAQVTPGNVGIQEGVQALFASLMGLSGQDVLLVTAAWRAIDTALILVTGPVSSYLLTGKAFGRPDNQSSSGESVSDPPSD